MLKTSFAFVREIYYHSQIKRLGNVDESCIWEILTDYICLITVYLLPETQYDEQEEVAT